MLSLRLKLLLFYTNRVLKYTSYGDRLPSEIRAKDREELMRLGFIVDYPPLPMEQVEDSNISMRDGASIPIRIYRPNKKKNLPTVAFFHGGGFVLRDIDSHDKACRRIAHTSEAVVVSVGYRLAPEYKFPIPMQDCYDATCWIAKRAHSLGGNPKQLVVMGDSAGGNLSTVVAIQARDLNGPKIAKQVLIYPATDARMEHASIDELGKKYFLTRAMMEWFTNHYKAKPADILNPLMSPLLTENLSQLPSTFVCTASHDPLKDEGEAYANRLVEAGNEVHFKEYQGTIHGFFNLTRLTKQNANLHRDIRDFIREK